MGAVAIVSPRSFVVDFSISYVISDIGALINVPRKLSKWAALLRPYRNNVWIPVVITLVLSGPIGYLISRGDISNVKKYSLEKVYETAFKIFTQQGWCNLGAPLP